LRSEIPRFGFERWTNGQLRLFWPKPAHSFIAQRRSSLAATNPWTLLDGLQTNDTEIHRFITPGIHAYYQLDQP
jgi:hypothetical protein